MEMEQGKQNSSGEGCDSTIASTNFQSSPSPPPRAVLFCGFLKVPVDCSQLVLVRLTDGSFAVGSRAVERSPTPVAQSQTAQSPDILFSFTESEQQKGLLKCK